MAEVLLRSFGIYTMIYFVFMKASKPLKNKWNWINYGIRPASLIGLVTNVGIVTYLEVQIAEINNDMATEDERT